MALSEIEYGLKELYRYAYFENARIESDVVTSDYYTIIDGL